MNYSLLIQSLNNKGNEKCFDCATSDPNWFSCDLGITLCQDCAVHHRGYGRYISFVRSTTLDNWNIKYARIAVAGGNDKFANYLQEQQIQLPISYDSSDLGSILESYKQQLLTQSNLPEIDQVIEKYEKYLRTPQPIQKPIQANDPNQQVNVQKSKNISGKVPFKPKQQIAKGIFQEE
ncbi:GTPase_activating protein for ARF [Hexamita inflata]|uniref:GTPase activating protein for ARF n=1 Tax=Hexamita inflata TaxID=28002 RepID=A0AA86UK81_9EUKA|nr:GTPase activating protein for ARF [Hexamita inflata]